MIIVGVDPGEMTGVAVFDADRFDILSLTQAPASGAVQFVWNLLEEHEDIAVACERYTISHATVRMSRQHMALEVTGALRFRCEEHDVEFVQYQPSDAKRLIDDDKLQRCGFWRGGYGHAMDALRQALVHHANLDAQTFLALLKQRQEQRGQG